MECYLQIGEGVATPSEGIYLWVLFTSDGNAEREDRTFDAASAVMQVKYRIRTPPFSSIAVGSE